MTYNHLLKSIINATRGQSKLNNKALRLSGMSSKRNRHLLNNIVNMPGVNYLEIGVHKGSTFVSALYQNNVNYAYAIDNWSEFGNAENTFLKNCNKFNINNFSLFNEDAFSLDLHWINHKINVYFYDGCHSLEAQRKALEYYYDVLDDTFIFIVDDYDWGDTQVGTMAGICKCNLKILYERRLKARFCGDKKTWWNGLYVSLLKKIK